MRASSSIDAGSGIPSRACLVPRLAAEEQTPEGARGAHAPLHAGHHRLPGRRQGRRPVLRLDRRGERRAREDAPFGPCRGSSRHRAARVAVVFQHRRTAHPRGGNGPKPFAAVVADGFDIPAYREGRFPGGPVSRFPSRRGVLAGREIAFNLVDQRALLLERQLRLSQVTRLAEDGLQTPILTTRMDLPALQVACPMSTRWRQEPLRVPEGGARSRRLGRPQDDPGQPEAAGGPAPLVPRPRPG